MIMSFRQIPLVAALVLARLAAVLAQDQNVQYNQVVNLNGNMQLNRVILPDGSRIETFSQTQRQLIVNQNTAPLPANHVVGSTGQPFIMMSTQSMTIQTNQANDLVGGQVIMSFDRNALSQNRVTSDNTFMAKLSPDRQAWVILEAAKSVNDGESNVRMVRQTSIDGEYVVVGRQTAETGQSLAPFSPDPNQAVRIAGSGIQEVEWQDGLRMSVRASQPMAISANVVNGVSAGMITSGTQPVNNYRYLVTSSLAGVIPDLNRMAAVVQIPLNGMRLMQTAQQMGAGPNDRVALSIEQRAVVQNPGGASALRPAPRNLKRQDPASSSAPAQSSSSPADPQASQPADPQASQPADPQQSAAPPASSNPAPQGQSSAPAATPSNPPPQGQQPPLVNAPPAATQLLLQPTFTPIARQTLLDMENNRVAVPVDQVDGEFILVMKLASAGQQPGQQPGQQSGSPLPGGQSQATPSQAPSSPQRIPGATPEQVPGQVGEPVGGTMGMIPVGSPAAPSTPGTAPGATPGQPIKRQAPPQLGTPGSVILSMADIQGMMARQQAGAAWVGVMIDQYVSQSTGQPIPNRGAVQLPPTKVRRTSRLERNRRPATL